MTPRQEATEEILYLIDRFGAGPGNREAYEEYLNRMNNKEFDAFIDRLENEEEILALWCPNLTEHKLSLERNEEIAKELGHDFFQYLRLTDQDTGQVTITPIKHMVTDQMLRRQAQMLYKKKNIPDHNKSVDERSGQATSDSKGASVSYPELMVNAAKGGLDSLLVEMIKARGGDVEMFNAMNRSIYDTGGVSLEALKSRGPTTVKANDTLEVFFKSMMLDLNARS